MTKREWVLLVINFANEKGLSPLKLQKSVFLLSKNLSEDLDKDFYNFIPYNYGPFSKEIYKDINMLVSDDLIKILEFRDKKWPEYLITSKGEKTSEKLILNLNDKTKKYLEKLVKWINDLSFLELINVIYSNYPEYKVHSVLFN